MISQALSAASSKLPFKPSLISLLKPATITVNVDLHHCKLHKRKVRHGTCRAEFSTDTPIGLAIGACVLNSLAFPIPPSPEDDEGDSVIDSADARFAVMGIISFIPYFNWLSWLFAWLDTGKRRYAVYAIVYLAPYLRPNLSISPEESWLPIASIVLCIIHIQLEASIRNGDIQGLQLFGEFGKHLSSNARKEDRISKEESINDHMKLPSAKEKSRNYIRDWGVPRKPFQDSKSLNKNDEEKSKATAAKKKIKRFSDT